MFPRRYYSSGQRPFTRRQLLRASASASLGSALFSGTSRGESLTTHAEASPVTRAIPATDATVNDTFPLGVASADPTPTGIVLWTHVPPSRLRTGDALQLELGDDEDFSHILLTQTMSGDELAERDGCATLILEGGLQPDRYYWYRFRYAGQLSRSGRCRTLPIAPVAEKPLRIAAVNCQEFSNGYYGAFRHLANEKDLAFVLHLGDSIYERVAGKAYLQHPHIGRRLVLPSGGDIAVDLNDYRALYRHYRSDPDYQQALAMHTFIFQMDDHEVTNNTYWNAAQNAIGVSDHPFGDVARYPDSVARLRQLRQDALRAWSEYMPSRLQIETTGTARPTLYRRVQVGDVAFLLIDSRSYRTKPPCKKTLLPMGCDEYNQAELTLLGETQREWLMAQFQDPAPRWTFLASQVAMSRIAVGNPRDPWGVANTDAWDGYAREREQLMTAIRATQHGRFVVLSGDMHASLAGVLQSGELAPALADSEQILGVEFMSPPISSPATIDLLFPRLRSHGLLRKWAADVLEITFEVMNPHLRYVSIQVHGYSVIEIDANRCHWQAKVVDIDVPSSLSSLRVAADFVYEPDQSVASLKRQG